ncbi:MAG: 1-acyl-sn-glycerol-3-phosphate acyltransferase [Deltaproteobacteria bacterium]|nr:1-acyl-sn-glycerol-3-phosphate acyltransferase [Deltaproteobacteria bacterium]
MKHKKPYFPFVVDYKPRFLLNWLLYKLFKRVRYNESMAQRLKVMNREGTVVYAVKYRGRLDYLLYHYRFLSSRLPYPKIAFNLNMALVLPLSQLFKVFKFYLSGLIKEGRFPSPFKTGFYEKAISEGTSALVCLVDPVGFTRHFIYAEKDPLAFLLETQKKMTRPIFVVPQLITYRKTPEKSRQGLFDIFFGFKDRIGFPRKIVLFFRHNRRAFIDFGEPINLRQTLADVPADMPIEQMTATVRKTLLESIDQQKRVILGPVLKSRQQFRETVLSDRKVMEAIEANAADKKTGLKQSRKKAVAYFDEIAADFNIVYIDFAKVVLTWIWKKMFQGLDYDPKELAELRQWAKKGPVIYVPSHKSHIDYLVLNYILYVNHLHIPRIAAGKNLSFWPLGNFYRKSGAFFIRRTFKGAKLYAEVFSRYIKALLHENYPLEFFIEGGRSRSGKLILPKIGFLSILIDAYREGYCDDLIFVPASIVYDRILEEQSYLKEVEGGKKKAENLQQFVKTRQFLKKKYGKIYVRFGQPFSLKQYLAERPHMEDKRHKHLAFHIIRGINQSTLVTPMAITATAILAKHRKGFQMREILETGEAFLKFLQARQTPISDPCGEWEIAIEETLGILLKSNVLETIKDVDEDEIFYFAKDEKKPELEYYKNSIIHYFIPHAFVSLSLLTGNREITPRENLVMDYVFLRNVFRYEFIFEEESETPEKTVNSIIHSFLETSLLLKSDVSAGFSLTRAGFEQMTVWANLVKTFLESYWIATRTIIKREMDGKKRSDMLKSMTNLGQRYHKMGMIEHLEAVSQITFKNAIRMIGEDFPFSGSASESEQTRTLEKLTLFSKQLHQLSQYNQ